MKSEYLETAKFILEVVKVMIPVLTGLLAVSASGIGRLWNSKPVITSLDLFLVTLIALLGLISFAAWATALAGAMIYTTGEQSSLLFFGCPSADEALNIAREAVGFGYSMLVATAFGCGFYYLSLFYSAKSTLNDN